MKRIISVIVLLAVSVGLFGCTAAEQTPEVTLPDAQKFCVPSPMAYPVYAFDHTPDTDELRKTAVQAMHDMLSIQWCTPQFLTYQKTGAVSGKLFSYVPEITFAGLPYTNGDAAIYNWFEYYDTTTGQLNFPGDGDEFNQILGNTCTGSIMWAWSSVCDSLTGVYDNYHMTVLNHCYPVGGYEMPAAVDSFLQYGTDQICKDNGREKILECYAQCLPADGLSSSPENHGMMVISPATVVRNEDGSINAEESYLEIQDQRAGTGSVFYTQEDPSGETVHYTGRTYAKYSFEQLYADWYIPVTTAEFMGTEAYAAAKVDYVPTKENYATAEEMLSGMLTSNFPMCILKLVLSDGEKDTLLVRVYMDKTHVKSGEARSFSLSALRSELNKVDMTQYMKKGQTCTLRLDVTVSTGEVMTVAQVQLAN